MSADNGIIINRKTFKAYYGQAGFYDKIAKGKSLDEVLDNVQKWIKQQEADGDGYFELEHGITFM